MIRAPLCSLVVLAVLSANHFAFVADAKAAAPADYQTLVSRADLTYDKPVAKSEDGLPIGNGRMGTLLWTTPGALKMQINRVDVFSIGANSESFPERHTDYCGGCGFVDIDFGDGSEVFPADATRQHLSCYDGLATVAGRGVTIRALAWHEQDVIALEIDDQRAEPKPILVSLRTLRPPVVKTGRHTATSTLGATDSGLICLTQEFREDDFSCWSRLGVAVIGREAKSWDFSETRRSFVVTPGRGKFSVLIGSGATFKPAEEWLGSLERQLQAAETLQFAGLLEANKKWWHDFWSRSFVSLRSDDGVADELEKNFTYYLYIMACTSRGKYATKFNGMIWTTDGDTRKWGAQYWGANQSCFYNNALLAANHGELLQPHFDTYTGMAESCGVAARQQWGSQGFFIPETVSFDGLSPLPDDIAAEMRELYLLRKPWAEMSQRFKEYAGRTQPHSSRWNWVQSGRWEDGRWIYQERGAGPYGPVTHIFSRGAKIAYQYWVRYEYTQDAAWLRDRAYPMLKGVAEFYRNYPNVKKGEDGKYHIHDVNSNESVWGAQDTDEEISSMRAVVAVALKAAELLQVDPELRAKWQDLLANLAPLPRSDHPNAPPAVAQQMPPVWIRGLTPIVRGRGNRPDGNTMPIWFFDLCTLESPADMLATGNATLDAYFPQGIDPKRRVGVLSKMPLVAATLGRADAVKYLVPNQVQTSEVPVLANRMDLREGTQTTSIQRLGNAADALLTALCHSFPGAPGEPAVIRVFAAWPREWDAQFTLLCRGGFLASSSMRKGNIEQVKIESQLGGPCRLRNPWGEGAVSLTRDGKTERLTGPLLTFATRRGEVVDIVPAK